MALRLKGPKEEEKWVLKRKKCSNEYSIHIHMTDRTKIVTLYKRVTEDCDDGIDIDIDILEEAP